MEIVTTYRVYYHTWGLLEPLTTYSYIWANEHVILTQQLLIWDGPVVAMGTQLYGLVIVTSQKGV